MTKLLTCFVNAQFWQLHTVHKNNFVSITMNSIKVNYNSHYT